MIEEGLRSISWTMFNSVETVRVVYWLAAFGLWTSDELFSHNRRCKGVNSDLKIPVCEDFANSTLYKFLFDSIRRAINQRHFSHFAEPCHSKRNGSIEDVSVCYARVSMEESSRSSGWHLRPQVLSYFWLLLFAFFFLSFWSPFVESPCNFTLKLNT